MAKKHKTAFTLVEVLMAMVILGVLMTAVAVAFDASVKNYQANEGIYRTVNAGRQVLLRLTSDIRTATNVSSDSDSENNFLNILSTEAITYRFHQPSGTLYLINSAADEYILCKNISSMTFMCTAVAGEPTLTRNVQIKMTVTDPDSNVTQTLVAAAVVRRNLDD